MVTLVGMKTKRPRLLEMDVLLHPSHRNLRYYCSVSGEERSHRGTELQCCPGDFHELRELGLSQQLKLGVSRALVKVTCDH